jgi:signal transduction histidine kinase
VCGFVIGLLAAVPAVVLLLRGRSRTPGAARTPEPGTDKPLREIEELGRLVGELAHEIKNPLSTIKVNLKLISEDLDASGFSGSGKADLEQDEQRFKRALRKIGVIQRETDRLEQILDDSLRYVDRTELQLATVDMNELLGDMIDFYSPQASSGSITIRQGLYGEPLTCRVDPAMLKQAVLNLFINARQAMSEGGELIVRTDKRQPDAVIQISDTGSGIASENLQNIFNAYYSSRPQGSGLGLPTAKKIIEAHNGTITVDSEPGKGTSFTIRLPLLAGTERT